MDDLEGFLVLWVELQWDCSWDTELQAADPGFAVASAPHMTARRPFCAPASLQRQSTKLAMQW